jgi:hypothetical protein
VARIDAPSTQHLRHQFAFDTSQLAQFTRVVHQSSRHSMKHACPFLKRAFGSRFDFDNLKQLRQMAEGSNWECHVKSQIGYFHPWHCSAARPLFGLPPWNTFTLGVDLRHRAGETTPITTYALMVEVLHPFIAVMSLYMSWVFMPRIGDALQMLVWERVTEVLSCRLFSWMSQAHRDLYWKALPNLFSDSSLVTLLPFHSGLRVRSIYSNVNRANSFVTVGQYRPCG